MAEVIIRTRREVRILDGKMVVTRGHREIRQRPTHLSLGFSDWRYEESREEPRDSVADVRRNFLGQDYGSGLGMSSRMRCSLRGRKRK